MSRSSRQSRILNLIDENEIETQDELVALLKSEGYDVTQATVSRDVKELGLVKAMSAAGKYKYVTPRKLDDRLSDKLLLVTREMILSVVAVENLVVVKTISSGGFAVRTALDKLAMPEIVGTVADSDTLLVVCYDSKSAQTVATKVNSLL